MAGIGFELRRVLLKRTLSSILLGFSYATALMAGPYIITIISILLSHFIALPYVTEEITLIKFQTLITYMVAFSLILSGFSQLVIARFLADRFFEGKKEILLPNLLGVILINMFFGSIFSLTFSYLFFKNIGIWFIFILSTCFSLLCGIWILLIVANSFKKYRYILILFVFSFIIFVLIIPFVAPYNLNGLLFAFSIPLFLIFSGLLIQFVKTFSSKELLKKDFMDSNQIFLSLIFSGFFYNLGVWIDKFIFWFHPITRIELMYPINISLVYDIPIFLAYLAIAPGMGVMFLKIEGEFALYYEKYYNAVREGATLPQIYDYGNQMIESARSVIFDTFRIQSITFVFILLFEKYLFTFFNIPLYYLPLFHVLMIGTFLQLMFVTLLTLLNYFDRRFEILISTFIFAILNGLLTYLSIELGPAFYGYGFVIALTVSNFICLIALRRFLSEIHYQTFMLY